MTSQTQAKRIMRAAEEAGGWRPLGRAVGINAGTLKRIADGTRKPSKKLVEKLASVGLAPKKRIDRVRVSWKTVISVLPVSRDQIVEAIRAQGIDCEHAERAANGFSS